MPQQILPDAHVSDDARKGHSAVVKSRRSFHQAPEVGLELPKTAQLIEGHLDALGIKHQRCIENGVVGLIDGTDPGPVVMLRADMDALPIVEATSHEYVSNNLGMMHACGHDTHMAMLLGATGRFVKDGLPLGTLKLVFQPGEEGHHGAQAMIDAGVMDAPKVNVAYAQHVWAGAPTGQILVESGPVMAAVDTAYVTVKGKGCHAAMPHQGTDCIVAAAQIVGALQTIVTRNVDARQPAVISVSVFQAGTAHNVIPPEAKLTLSVRVFDDEMHSLIERRIHEVINGVANALGCSAEIDYVREHSATVNDEGITQIVREEAIAIVGEDNVIGGDRTMGAEDMSDFLKHVPGCFAFIGAQNEAKDCIYPHHHPKFDIDEDALLIGTELMYRVAHRLLKDNP